MFHSNQWFSVIAVAASCVFLLGASAAFAHDGDHKNGHDHDQCKMCEKKLSKMDADGDGKISRREFMRFHGKLFNKHDLNNDGFMDMDELHWMMEDMHQKKHDKHGKKHKDGHSDDHGHGHGDDKHGHDKDHDHGEKHSHDHEDEDAAEED